MVRRRVCGAVSAWTWRTGCEAIILQLEILRRYAIVYFGGLAVSLCEVSIIFGGIAVAIGMISWAQAAAKLPAKGIAKSRRPGQRSPSLEIVASGEPIGRVAPRQRSLVNFSKSSRAG